MTRYFSDALDAFSKEKFVFLSGPRQVGKTTLAKAWAKPRDGIYLNWDSAEDRKAILNLPAAFSGEKFDQPAAMVLDEIHKYARWKTLVKGLFDKAAPALEVVVTGSARLDVYQRGGDSLFGRYELLRLHPLSVGELVHQNIPNPPSKEEWLSIGREVEPDVWIQLGRRGGFPEPFFRDEQAHHRRWTRRRRELLIQQDLRDLSAIKTLSLVEHLAILLPMKVGGLLSLNSLREDLAVAHDTVRSWLEALERLYFCHRISPFSKRLARSLKKEQKLYLWDWSEVEGEAARFENMVAGHLVKAVDAWNDLGLGSFSLHYWRDLEKREVDFVIADSGKPVVAVECKVSDQNFSSSLEHFGAAFPEVPLIQLVNASGIDKRRGRSRVVSADRFLAGLV